VAVGLVDHLHRRPHQAGELEDRDARLVDAGAIEGGTLDEIRQAVREQVSEQASLAAALLELLELGVHPVDLDGPTHSPKASTRRREPHAGERSRASNVPSGMSRALDLEEPRSNVANYPE
jgi:hypothetical protein